MDENSLPALRPEDVGELAQRVQHALVILEAEAQEHPYQSRDTKESPHNFDDSRPSMNGELSKDRSRTSSPSTTSSSENPSTRQHRKALLIGGDDDSPSEQRGSARSLSRSGVRSAANYLDRAASQSLVAPERSRPQSPVNLAPKEEISSETLVSQAPPVPKQRTRSEKPVQAIDDSQMEEKSPEHPRTASPRPASHARTVSVHSRVEADEGASDRSITSADTETEWLSGFRLAVVTAALALTVFVVAMDVNIISTAIPSITNEFNSVDDIGWYGSAFLMTTCTFQIPFGRMFTLAPPKWVFVTSLAIFEIGSLISAMSPSSIVFIIGRAVQGIGTSGILSGTLIIISFIVPLGKRSLLTGIISSMEGVAMVTAPLIGGVLTEKVTWRWCFWINLPIGGAVLCIVLAFLKVPTQPGQRAAASPSATRIETIIGVIRKLDPLGTAILMAAIICILLALQWGGTKYAWSSLAIILLFVLFALLLAIFFYFQNVKQDLAMVPPRIIKHRTVLAGAWFLICTSSALEVMVYYLPIWFQGVLGVSAITSAVHLLPMILGLIIFVLIASAFVSAFGFYAPFMLFGAVLMSAGAGLLSTLTPDIGSAFLIVYPALFGAGVGNGFQQPLIAVQAALPERDAPIGMSIIVLGQSLGPSIILSVAQAIFTDSLSTSVGVSVTGADGSLTDLAALAAQTGIALERLRDAVSNAVTQAFYVSVAMACLSALGALTIERRNVKEVEAERAKQGEREGGGSEGTVLDASSITGT